MRMALVSNTWAFIRVENVERDDVCGQTVSARENRRRLYFWLSVVCHKENIQLSK